MSSRMSFVWCVFAVASVFVAVGPASVARADTTLAEWFNSSGNVLADSVGGNTLTQSGADNATWESSAPSGTGLSGSVHFDGNARLQTAGNLDLSSYKTVRFSWWQLVNNASDAFAVLMEDGATARLIVSANDGVQGHLGAQTRAIGDHGWNVDGVAYASGSTNTTWEKITFLVDLNAGNATDLVQLWNGSTAGVGRELYQDYPALNLVSDVFILGMLHNGNGGLIGNIADFKVESVGVPEPGALVLLATGVIALLAYAWKKRR
jgi:hypothetical protein